MSPSTPSARRRGRADAEAAAGDEALKDDSLISPEIDLDDAPADDGWGGGAPARKPRSFWPSARRLGGLMMGFKAGLAVVLLFITGSVVLSVLAPMLLGQATNVVFAGVLSRDLPQDASQAEVIDGLRAEGRDSLADVFSTMTLQPGAGVDFGRLGQLIVLVLDDGRITARGTHAELLESSPTYREIVDSQLSPEDPSADTEAEAAR